MLALALGMGVGTGGLRYTVGALRLCQPPPPPPPPPPRIWYFGAPGKCSALKWTAGGGGGGRPLGMGRGNELWGNWHRINSSEY